jgi:hypothetical protein
VRSDGCRAAEPVTAALVGRSPGNESTLGVAVDAAGNPLIGFRARRP